MKRHITSSFHGLKSGEHIRIKHAYGQDDFTVHRAGSGGFDAAPRKLPQVMLAWVIVIAVAVGVFGVIVAALYGEGGPLLCLGALALAVIFLALFWALMTLQEA